MAGRDRECAEIDALLDRARGGLAGALVLRGEPGVGKSALLRHAVDRASDATVVRATGVESEAEIEFSGLLEVARPLLGLLDLVPAGQAAALRVALGFEGGATPDRFSVGAATLALFAAAADGQPLLVVVDDAQWVDRASLDAILFASRRLMADRVALLLATRTEGLGAQGLTELSLAGLDAEAARAVVEASAGVHVSSVVVERLLAETGGNPLALSEMTTQLTSAQLQGRDPLEGPLPVTGLIERAFAARVDALPDRSRRALGVLAAAGAEPLPPVLAALDRLGLGESDLAPAEAAGLVELSPGSFAFRHPLLRSVAYHGVEPAFRREAHGALAAALEGGARERQAWHLASAALGPDDAAADALAEIAAAARRRGGDAAAAAALERSARLTTDAVVRLERLVEAAETARAGGVYDRAHALADELLRQELPALLRARVLGVTALMAFHAHQLDRARAAFEEGAALARPEDRRLAATMLSYAVLVLLATGRVEETIEIGRRAVELARDDPRAIWIRYMLGRALLIGGLAGEGAPLIEATYEAHRHENTAVGLRRAGIAAAMLDRMAEARPLAERAIDIARREGGPLELVYALSLHSQIAVHCGEWTTAIACATEGRQLAEAIGQQAPASDLAATIARIGGFRGDRTVTDQLAGYERFFSECGHVFHAEQSAFALGRIALAHDDFETAVDRLGRSAERLDRLGVVAFDLAPWPDLVEALVRWGHVDRAREIGSRWVAAPVEAGPWREPLVERVLGLVASDDASDAHYERSIELARPVGDPYEEARTRLLYGEHLRRRGRRVEARDQLRVALEVFERLDADTWAERARRELRATGEKLRRDAAAGDELTPQELQVALQVAEGKANKDVAAALFLSQKTVEFHLSRIYRKLGLSSRTELVRHLAVTAQA